MRLARAGLVVCDGPGTALRPVTDTAHEAGPVDGAALVDEGELGRRAVARQQGAAAFVDWLVDAAGLASDGAGGGHDVNGAEVFVSCGPS